MTLKPTDADVEPMVRVQGISIDLGQFTLRDVTLDVEAGHYLVVLGPTGAGKTVLLECIAGLHRRPRGEIFVGGERVTHWPPEARGVGYLPQDYGLFPHLSVFENIAYGLRERRAPSAVVDKQVPSAAQRLGIGRLLARSPVTLSGGEQQRVALARALVVHPAVLLLDEPMGALDLGTRAALVSLLGELHHELGTTVIHVTHDFNEVFLLAGRVAVLVDGRLLQEGTPEEVFAHPAHEQVARLVRTRNLWPADDLARVAAPGTARAVSSDGAVVCCRPEDVMLTQERPADGLVLSGTIREVIPRGPIYEVSVDAGISVVALLSKREFAHLRSNPGDSVYVQIVEASTHILRGGDTCTAGRI